VDDWRDAEHAAFGLSDSNPSWSRKPRQIHGFIYVFFFFVDDFRTYDWNSRL